MIFEHKYKNQIWYCVTNNKNNYAYFFNVYNIIKKFGRQGDTWRYKIIKPKKSNLTLLRLSDNLVPSYNLVHCFMFKHEEDAHLFLDLTKNMEVEQ